MGVRRTSGGLVDTYTDCQADEKVDKNRSDVRLHSPQVDVTGAGNGEERYAPWDSANDHFGTPGSELVETRATEQAVHQSPACIVSEDICLERLNAPDIEHPIRWCKIRLPLTRMEVVSTTRCSDNVYVPC